jgi:N-acetyltransferase
MLTTPTLSGRFVRLEPLSQDHVSGLVEAAAEDRANFQYSSVPNGEADFIVYVRQNLELAETGRQLTFAVRRLVDDRIVGSTRFMDLEVFCWPPRWTPGDFHGPAPTDEAPPSVAEIGATWYSASAQRTVVNTECKLLLLTYAFEAWGVLRVTLKTDARNERSRAAIGRIGGVFEGIRRVHTPAVDGGTRDTAYFSIVKDEWPPIKERLTAWRDQSPDALANAVGS